MVWVGWACEVVLLAAIALCHAKKQIHNFRVGWRMGSLPVAKWMRCGVQACGPETPLRPRHTPLEARMATPPLQACPRSPSALAVVRSQFSLWSLAAVATSLAISINYEAYARLNDTPEACPCMP